MGGQKNLDEFLKGLEGVEEPTKKGRRRGRKVQKVENPVEEEQPLFEEKQSILDRLGAQLRGAMAQGKAIKKAVVEPFQEAIKKGEKVGAGLDATGKKLSKF
jgi:hypothetical protein